MVSNGESDDEYLMDLTEDRLVKKCDILNYNNKSIAYSITNAAEKQDIGEGERLFNLAVTLSPGEKTLTLHEVRKVIRAKRKKIQKTNDKITALNNMGFLGISEAISAITMIANRLTLSEKENLIKDPKFLNNLIEKDILNNEEVFLNSFVNELDK